GVRVGEPDSAREILDDRWIVARIPASAAIRSWPVGFLEFGGVLAGQPPVSVRGDRGLEEEVVAESKSERQFVVIRAGGISERESWFSVHRHPGPGYDNIAEHQVMRRVLLVDEDDMLDLVTRFSQLSWDGVLRVLNHLALHEPVVDQNAFGVGRQLIVARFWNDVHRPDHGELRGLRLADEVGRRTAAARVGAVERFAVSADVNGAGPPARWNMSEHTSRGSFEPDHANRVHAGFGDVEILPIRAQVQPDRLHAAQRNVAAAERCQPDPLPFLAGRRIKYRDAVVVAVRDVNPLLPDNCRVRVAAAVGRNAVSLSGT